ncbi:MAG: hypothetical protein LCH76_12055 [Actinobacteria bacterium]|nr:hypothetical protein [Actinomycetota bacterium]
MQTERRTTPYPFTWEVPAGVVTVVAVLLVAGVHFGRGLANWMAGAGWHWPGTVSLVTSVPEVLAGDATAGLVPSLATAASGAAVLGWVVAVEVFVLIVGTAVGAWLLRRWGPGRLKGMATVSEAEASLGLSRLRRVRRIIRPDLYPARRARS